MSGNSISTQLNLQSIVFQLQIWKWNMTVSYILNIDLQRSFIMVKVLGELEPLVIKGEDCLKEGQHLKQSQNRKRQSQQEAKHYDRTTCHMNSIVYHFRRKRESQSWCDTRVVAEMQPDFPLSGNDCFVLLGKTTSMCRNVQWKQ